MARLALQTNVNNSLQHKADRKPSDNKIDNTPTEFVYSLKLKYSTGLEQFDEDEIIAVIKSPLDSYILYDFQWSGNTLTAVAQGRNIPIGEGHQGRPRKELTLLLSLDQHPWATFLLLILISENL